MRYFGKEGKQCEICISPDANGTLKVRQVARGVLFGRVSKAAVLSLGMAALAIVLAAGLFSITNLSSSSRICKDYGSAIMTRR